MQNKDDGGKPTQNVTAFSSGGALKKQGIFKKILVIIGSLAVTVLVIAGILYGLGILKMSLQVGSAGAGSVHTIVCDYGIVADYNKILATSVTSKEENDAVTESLTQFAKKVQEKSDYAQDPACLYISYNAAYRAGDMAAATGYVDKIDVLAKENAFIDSRLNGIQSISQMRMMIEAQKGGSSALGSG